MGPVEEDVLELTKKQLLVEVVRLRALLSDEQGEVIRLEGEVLELKIKIETLENRNSEVLNKLLDRELNLTEQKQEVREGKGPQPVSRRQPWRNVASKFTKDDRQAINDGWKKKIKEVEANDGMNATSADAK